MANLPLVAPAVTSSWKQILRSNVRTVEQLCQLLELDQQQRDCLLEQPKFPLNIPRRLVDKMAKGSIDDPLFKQFVPLRQEREKLPGYSPDPLTERGSCRKGSKLLHKYFGRALLVATGACAVHCRYCFRQHFDYGEEAGFEEELAQLHQDSSIEEVILSGGDPLSLSERPLGTLLEAIGSIPHVRRIRFHTRFPVGIPERIDDLLCQQLYRLRQRVIFVFHINHPREIDEDHFRHFGMLLDQGVLLLNQAVLLRGINDTGELLKELCLKLIDGGVLPYYLHQLDRVEGAAHFEVPIGKGKELMRWLATQLPGYALPRYMQEVPGELHKITLLP